jgi:hypothetical protein
VTGPGRVQFAEGRGGASYRLGRWASERCVPAADRVGDERVEAERPAVSAGAVAAAFPEAINELGDRTILSSARSLRKDLE